MHSLTRRKPFPAFRHVAFGSLTLSLAEGISISPSTAFGSLLPEYSRKFSEGLEPLESERLFDVGNTTIRSPPVDKSP